MPRFFTTKQFEKDFMIRGTVFDNLGIGLGCAIIKADIPGGLSPYHESGKRGKNPVPG